MSTSHRLLAPLLLALLLVASAAAFGVVENERDHPKIIEHDAVYPTPTSTCPAHPSNALGLAFTITRGERHATIVVVDESDRVVHTIADDIPLADDGSYTFGWDGIDDAGTPVPPGRYRVRIQLGDLNRDLPLPSTCIAGEDAGGR